MSLYQQKVGYNRAMQYWLVKSEADCYSIADLKRDKTTAWTEVRNYQARNFIRDMKKGDHVLFYHSNGGKETGIVGEAKVVKEAYPDPTQFDKKSEYFDIKSTTENPRWSCVDVGYVSTYQTPIYLNDLKANPSFRTISVTQKGSRLSVLPILEKHFKEIQKLGKK